MAKYYEFGPHDLLATVLTDSAELYGSRISELREKEGAYTGHAAPVGHARHMLGLRTDWLKELTYVDKRQLHNQKYYTWVEQHGKSVKELDELWYGDAFQSVHGQAAAIDKLIEAFNEEAAK